MGCENSSNRASTDKKYSKILFLMLIEHLTNSTPRDLPLHAESIFPAVDSENKKEFLAVLESRKNELKPSQVKRLRKLSRSLEAKQLKSESIISVCLL